MNCNTTHYRANSSSVPGDPTTGFVDQQRWNDWLAQAACAVQLREQSHGESSAALGELLAAGLSVVCTDTGSFAELPEGVVRHVPAGVSPERLAEVLAEVLDPTESARLTERAQAFVRDECSPQLWAENVAGMVEAGYEGSLGVHWAEASVSLPPSQADESLLVLPAVPRSGYSPWLTDVSVYANTPFFSGIQRVTSRLHHELASVLDPRDAWLHPTRITDGLPDRPHPAISRDEMSWLPPVPTAEADWLLCVDLNVRLARHREEFLAARSRGLRVAVVVHDIIPVLKPEWFPREAGDVSFAAWLRWSLDVADLVVANSAATADDLRRYSTAHPPRRDDGLDLAVVPWGWDFSPIVPCHGNRAREVDHFLMVGTVEPRKGHAEVLASVEAMWATGVDTRLTVVGRRGWMVDDVVHTMERLQRSERRFRWVEGGSDQELEELYSRCTALVMASYAEGFGLPVVEAALRGCPVVLRDIPVMREIGGPEATYFATDGSDLGDVLTNTLERAALAQLPRRPVEHLRTWAEAARDLASLLRGEHRPEHTWSPLDRAWHTDGANTEEAGRP